MGKNLRVFICPVFFVPGLAMDVVIAITAVFTSSLFTVIIFLIVSSIIERKIANNSSGIKKIANTIIQITRILLSIYSYILCFILILLLFHSVLKFAVFPIIIIQFIVFIIFRNRLNKVYTNILLLLEPYILTILLFFCEINTF